MLIHVSSFPLPEFTEAEDCHIFQVGDAKNWVSTLWKTRQGASSSVREPPVIQPKCV